MAKVHFSSGLSQHTGVQEITIDAPRVRDLLDALARRFPGLETQLSGMAVAIDGQIYNDADYQTLQADTELYFVPRLAGG
jgi:molybdopterin converting factor small subunit